ncbi:hypothetical protein DEO72_LG2g4352 [Vigna unguiculata]|uniref:Uncharacterized protein n=1 Tax=Vigna unguiculata TaxID=3917 RepID=A0A4D6L644_VIGUN|nr:hypothetical protein DEO72_LG2g4352 [Vigna unguiculata]
MTLSLGMVRSMFSFRQRPSPWDWSSSDPPFIATLSVGMVNSCVLLSNNDPLLRNDNDPLFGIGQVKILLSDNDPLLGNGQVQVMTLSLGMVKSNLSYRDPLHENGIDPLLWNGQINIASRPSPWDWSSIPLHRGPLRGNGHRFLYIKTLSFGMVIDSLCRIETLSMRLVIVSFTSRSSAKQWSLISWLHHDPLQGPLRRNGHRFLDYIKNICKAMVSVFLQRNPLPRNG